ncbi:hypothetical protein [Streptomyces sp. NBC_01481]|uniref:hypothetical protein n=1 Tax=Streptomyces sp. NBC_01481 TaxID=2975869 RepID=UPI0022515F0A|nr:hypothetical protein [Streptomyces sp. NBC_01481]MCX4584452.1 hypothetical protein [Streptomyces sp. NBC_01481]
MCQLPAAQGRPGPRVLRIAEQVKSELDLKSVLLRVTRDGREVITAALGESMTGVPAEPGMHFRAGFVAIAPRPSAPVSCCPGAPSGSSWIPARSAWGPESRGKPQGTP